jgi:hypothetical protein
MFPGAGTPLTIDVFGTSVDKAMQAMQVLLLLLVLILLR